MLVLPMGATEQHGPHLPVGMDVLLVEKVCEAVSERVGVAVMSALRYAVSEGHTGKWPGTFSLRHETFVEVLMDLAGWVKCGGWRRLLLVNSHFGNDAVARVAVDRIRLKYEGSLQVGLVHVFQSSEEVWQAYKSDAGDLHANRAETSLMMYLFPGLVDEEAMRGADDEDRTVGKVFSYPVSQTSLNGVTGRPSEATVEEGRVLFERMVDDVSEVVRRGMVEEPPLGWDVWAEGGKR